MRKSHLGALAAVLLLLGTGCGDPPGKEEKKTEGKPSKGKPSARLTPDLSRTGKAKDEGVLKGRLRDRSGNGLEGVEVFAQPRLDPKGDLPWVRAVTRADGSYRFTGLRLGADTFVAAQGVHGTVPYQPGAVKAGRLTQDKPERTADLELQTAEAYGHLEGRIAQDGQERREVLLAQKLEVDGAGRV
jgi:hypothetical protein